MIKSVLSAFRFQENVDPWMWQESLNRWIKSKEHASQGLPLTGPPPRILVENELSPPWSLQAVDFCLNSCSRTLVKVSWALSKTGIHCPILFL